MKKTIALNAIALTLLLTISSAIYLWHADPSQVDLNILSPGCAAAVVDQPAVVEDSSPDNCAVRRWYLQQVSDISLIDKKLATAGNSLKQRAQCAFTLRHRARIGARTAMSSAIDIVLLRFRDLRKYGHSDGPTFEQLLEKNLNDQRNNQDFAWRQIISSAQRTNQQVNDNCAMAKTTTTG